MGGNAQRLRHVHRPGEVIVVADDKRAVQAVYLHDLLAEQQVFVRVGRLGLHQDAVFRHALLHQVAAHDQRLRHPFSIAQSPRDDQGGHVSFPVQPKR
jgi:hypothetical protein